MAPAGATRRVKVGKSGYETATRLAIPERHRQPMDRGQSISVGVFTFLLHAFLARADFNHSDIGRRFRIWPGSSTKPNSPNHSGTRRTRQRESRAVDDSGI